jgi:glycogen operon protein
MTDAGTSGGPLAELAERSGIECDYIDAHGERCEISADTQRAVLRALGIDASSDAAVRAALDREERQRWLRALPSVRVVRQGSDEHDLEIVVSEEISRCHWQIDLEDGRQVAGDVSLDELAVVDREEVDEVRMQRRRLVLPADLPQGYHVLRIDSSQSTCRLIVCPAQCWLPQSGENETRLWGVAAQLYSIRSRANWGIGDFTDLYDLMRGAVDRGVDIVGVNPLHALFPDDPERASPYSPSSRVLLNPLYLDVTAIEGFRDVPESRALLEQPEFREKLSSCQAADLVQYSAVAELKLPLLQLLFTHAARDRSSGEWREFEAFRAEQGEALRLGCLFQALREHFARLDRSKADWREWPPEFQDPGSTSVVAFAGANENETTFLAWLQWQADRQLARATAADPRMRVGLYRDLAVGTDPTGAECWSNQALTLSGVHIGAPPDLFQKHGQDWGLAPYHPRKLQEEGYEPFVALLRANMRHAGALRLDHAMSLERLYWIADGALPRDGAYVRYPVNDLVAIVALESQRNRCIVVGEDLGTVRPEFREQMRDAGILSYRVLSFERDKDGGFLPAQAYPRLALAVAGNHDLPTLRGWWEGRDIALNARVKATKDSPAVEKELKERDVDRARLLEALGRGGAAVDSVTAREVIGLVHAFLQKTPCLLAMAQLDDLEGEPEPANLPGTSDEYPNWRRRLGRARDPHERMQAHSGTDARRTATGAVT